MTSQSITTPDRLESAERHAEAFRLRLAGHDYVTIAERLGYSGKSSVNYALTSELERRVGRPCEEYRQLQLARFEALWAKQFKRFEALGDELDLKLISEMRGTIMDMAKLSGLTSAKFQINLAAEEEEAEPADMAPAPKASPADQLQALLEKLRARAAERAKSLPISEVATPDPGANGFCNHIDSSIS